MEAFVRIHMDYCQWHHNNFAYFNRTNCRYSIPIPGADCLPGRFKFIQYRCVVYNHGKLWRTVWFNFFRHYCYKCNRKLDCRYRRLEL